MSLEKCRECKSKVSSEAKTCPHCGIDTPYKPPPPPTKWEKRIGNFIACAIFGLLVWGGWNVYHYESPPKTPEEIAQEKVTLKKKKLEDNIRELPIFCRHLIRKAVTDELGGSIHKWGRDRQWKKGRLYYTSHRVAVKSDLGGVSYFKVTCNWNPKTNKVNLANLKQV